MEAQATTGGKDVSGGANRSRGFDFNVFAAELFNSITVRKSTTAEVDEGSLGATVDLQTARPFDYKGFAMAGQLEESYNDLAKSGGPRGSFLISNRWAGGKLGALFSVAYGTRDVQEEGPNTTRWENAFSTVTAGSIGKVANISTDGGTTFFADCLAATASGACGPTAGGSTANLATSVAVNSALHPRIPRYSRFVTHEKRLGMTASFQARPNEKTLLTLDMMYADFSANRDEYDFEAIGFSRGAGGFNNASIYNYTIDSATNTITKASFNGIDIRAEHRFDELDTKFTQVNLKWEQTLTDKLSFKAQIGTSSSKQNTPEQTTFTFESYDVQGYSYDFTDPQAPIFNYGKSATNCNSTQACYWTYAGSQSTTSAATAGPLTNLSGDASLIRIRPQSVTNTYGQAKFDLKYIWNDHITFKGGAAYKQYTFDSKEFGRYIPGTPQTRDEAANQSGTPGLTDPFVTTLNSNLASYAQTVTIGANTFLVPNLDKIRSDFQYDCNCVNAYGIFTVNNTNSSSRTNNRFAKEKDFSTYLQMDFNFDLWSVPFRGNIGARVADTDEDVVGFIGKGTAAVPTEVKTHYSNTLPSMNISAEPFDNFFIRFAMAKTMARPTLVSLTPGGSIATSTQTIGTATGPVGNPLLKPNLSNNTDLSFEWYPDKEGLLSVSFFKKDLKSYIQTIAFQAPFGATGYDISLLSGTTQDATTPYLVYTAGNSPGGPINGYEINLQHPFTFLPGSFLKHFGGVVNYTNIASKITYIQLGASQTLATASSITQTYVTNQLLGLSPISWNATLYYSDDKLDARVAMSSRSDYLSLLNPGSAAFAAAKLPTQNIDAQITYKLNKHFTLVAEGINLTDEYDRRTDIYALNTPASGTTPAVVINNSAAQLDYSHPGRTYYVGVRYKY
jgi:TonB-dependent receptor